MDTLENLIIPIIGILVSFIVAYMTARKVHQLQLNNGKVLLLEIIMR